MCIQRKVGGTLASWTFITFEQFFNDHWGHKDSNSGGYRQEEMINWSGSSSKILCDNKNPEVCWNLGNKTREKRFIELEIVTKSNLKHFLVTVWKINKAVTKIIFLFYSRFE